MTFHLFGDKKEKLEQQQTQEIKEATLSPSDLKIDTGIDNLNKENSNFNNPFAKTQTNTVKPTDLPPMESVNLVQTPKPNIPIESSSSPISQTPTSPISSPTSTIDPVPETNLDLEENSTENTSMDLEKTQEMIDETVEKLIEEKWEKLLDSVEKVLKWKDKQENQMVLIKEDIVSMKENLEIIESKIMNKISSYDRNILDVNSEIKALEKVFQKITPTLINNVNELSRIADEFKGSKLENKVLEKEGD